MKLRKNEVIFGSILGVLLLASIILFLVLKGKGEESKFIKDKNTEEGKDMNLLENEDKKENSKVEGTKNEKGKDGKDKKTKKKKRKKKVKTGDKSLTPEHLQIVQKISQHLDSSVSTLFLDCFQNPSKETAASLLRHYEKEEMNMNFFNNAMKEVVDMAGEEYEIKEEHVPLVMRLLDMLSFLQSPKEGLSFFFIDFMRTEFNYHPEPASVEAFDHYQSILSKSKKLNKAFENTYGFRLFSLKSLSAFYNKMLFRTLYNSYFWKYAPLLNQKNEPGCKALLEEAKGLVQKYRLKGVSGPFCTEAEEYFREYYAFEDYAEIYRTRVEPIDTSLPCKLPDHPPRPVVNASSAVCYAIAVFQAIANIIPILPIDISEMNFDSLNPDARSIIQVFKELTRATEDPFSDFESYLPSLKKIGSSTLLFDSIFNVFTSRSIATANNSHLSRLFSIIGPGPGLQNHITYNDLMNNDDIYCQSPGLVIEVSGEEDFSHKVQVKEFFSKKPYTYVLSVIIASNSFVSAEPVTGHAVAFLQRGNGQWYLADDAQIFKVSEAQLPLKQEHQKDPQALNLPIKYSHLRIIMLFYQREL